MELPPARAARDSARLAAVERRLLELESASDPSAAPSASAPVPSLNVEELQAQHRQQHDKLLARHRAEPRMAAWATEAENLLAPEFAELGEHKNFSVTKLDCRATTCAIVLAWPSFGEATTSYSALLHAPYRVNCERQILLPEPEDVAARYEATLVLSCQGNRADFAQQ